MSDTQPAKKSRLNVGSFTLAALVVTVGVMAAAVIFTSPSDDVPEASTIAELPFTLDDGETASLAAFSGEPLVVNFFASWCAPCRAELPDFEQVHLETQDSVTFLGVSHDSSEDAWLGFVEETEITYQTSYQPGQEIWSRLDALSLPSTAFVGPDGTVEHVHNGVLDQAQLRQLIDTHLTEI